ncbi:hypothetical protein ACQEU6_08875 [Spirillospora sp. CA-108201]
MSHGNHTDDDRRPCVRGTRCDSAMIVWENGHTLRLPALGYRTLCDADRAGLKRTIIALPGLYDVANSMLGDHPAPQHGADARPTGRPTPPTLVNTGMDELMRTAYHLVASWYERVDTVAGGRGYTTAQTGRLNHQAAIREMAWCLAKNIDALLALRPAEMVRYISLQAADELPDGEMVRRHYAAGYATWFPAMDGGDACNELMDLAARARRRLGLTGSDVDLPVPCTQPDCGERGHMVRPDGAVGLEDYAVCRSCGHRYEDTPDDPAFSDLMKDVAAWNIARAKKNRTKETTSP